LTICCLNGKVCPFLSKDFSGEISPSSSSSFEIRGKINRLSLNLSLLIRMKFTWRGKWREGEITVEAETREELERALHELLLVKQETREAQTNDEKFPHLPTGLGCSDAIRALFQTDWGRLSPRSMAEINSALEANTVHLTKGSLSGTLTLMTKREELERLKKKGKWVYSLRSEQT